MCACCSTKKATLKRPKTGLPFCQECSTVLAYVMKTLNERHDYGLELFLLSIDEGITGYRDDSLETVKRNQVQYSLPLKIVSYEELYGWTMDAIVQKIGLKSNCTFCGVFRRQALDRGALLLGVDKIVTGHNADDIAETVIMNVLRGDIARLKRCTSITTGLQKTGLLHHRVHLFTQRVQRPRQRVSQRFGGCQTERHHRHHLLRRQLAGA